jgi:alkanesulfonate monooxygenase SsuD/methylene tetrahydromethanopterin reductase-like flavin-dependent oxidoreductase (luciferase family)
VGELSEGWMPFLVPPAELGAFVDRLDAGRADRSAELPDRIAVAPSIPAIVSADEGAARAVMNELVTTYLLAMGDFYGPFLEGIGFADEGGRDP